MFIVMVAQGAYVCDLIGDHVPWTPVYLEQFNEFANFLGSIRIV